MKEHQLDDGRVEARRRLLDLQREHQQQNQQPHHLIAGIGLSFTSLFSAGRSVSQIAFNFASSASIFVTSSSRTATCCAVGAHAPSAAESATPESLSFKRIG